MAKIAWVQLDKRRLCGSPDNIDFLTEEDFVLIANWCDENNCGRRISFDMFDFKNEKQMTAFLLKWG